VKVVWKTASLERFMPDYEFCKVERDGRLTVITLNRPDVMNALHPPAHFELAQVFDAFAADPEQWVGIVTGAGDRAFSAGNDLKYTASGAKMSSPPSGFAGLTSRFDLDKPLIAAVNGIAMGGGFEIALACDIIVAADSAVFALPEPRVGLAALAGGLHRLPREIGTKRALGMILTGRRVSAQEGKELGFVNAVVPAGELMATAKKMAAGIATLSPMSVRASKQAVYRGLGEASLAAAIKAQASYPAVAAMFKSEDLLEGPRAFAEKRPPQWKGK
jgi:crotonobetainyl-CoA hydratase